MTRIIMRIIGFPFFAVLSLFACTMYWFIYMRNYIIHGGEAIAYTQKMNRKSIQDVFVELQKQQETPNTLNQLIS